MTNVKNVIWNISYIDAFRAFIMKVNLSSHFEWANDKNGWTEAHWA